MFIHPGFDPVAISIGPVAIRWYGLMYLLGFLSGWLLGRYRAKQSWRGWTVTQVDDFVTYVILGVVLGGRLGYVLFYQPQFIWTDPLEIFAIWHGGMSFHGGLLGVIVACWWFARRHGKSIFDVGDFVAPLIAPGLFFGRLGNFINAELWGRVTDGPWGMVFPGAGAVPRHASQLYEATLEGLVLFLLVWFYSASPRPKGAVGGAFLVGYGAFRFIVEFARQPDAHLGYIAFGWLTMGQILCVPMILFGAWLMVRNR
ncbi:prolipoprotein diacylglyceryl transferase [Salidesulfovibrio brasiliensis]|uniref:prolipoprotein diacylglyceryl transferase n=1 Tax=Salidesulfovibrio brasiliensis TaxID=221711 RepID=UPI0006D177A6|nr:prolipoprotein diacylglyceryl transferase [Salidesulfovibrio brasiliensis]